jgi:ADP-glucose pyrophosphorylase
MLAGRVRGIDVKDNRASSDLATHSEIDRLSVVGDDCTVKPGAQIINSVLGEGVHVEERARIENSVVWPHTRVGAGAHVSGAVVGRGCHIGRSAQVGAGAVLGDKTNLTDYTQTGGAL